VPEAVRIKTLEQFEAVLCCRGPLVITDVARPAGAATLHASPRDCVHVGEKGFTTKVLENRGRNGSYFTVASLAEARGAWPSLSVCGSCGIASVGEGQLGEALTAATGAEAQRRGGNPEGAEVDVEEHGWKTTQRIAIGRVDGAMVIRTWPAEKKAQARALYGTDAGFSLVALASGPTDWRARPNPHLAFKSSKPDQRFYFPSPMSLAEYVGAWSRPDDLGAVHQYEADEVAASLWPWLRERGYARGGHPEDEAGLARYLDALRLRSFPPLLRPGLEMEWTCESGGHEDLRHEVEEAVRILARALGEPLPDRDDIAGS
jgi:hypothetical protein